jgi:hypothetical protein
VSSGSCDFRNNVLVDNNVWRDQTTQTCVPLSSGSPPVLEGQVGEENFHLSRFPICARPGYLRPWKLARIENRGRSCQKWTHILVRNQFPFSTTSSFTPTYNRWRIGNWEPVANWKLGIKLRLPKGAQVSHVTSHDRQSTPQSSFRTLVTQMLSKIITLLRSSL